MCDNHLDPGRTGLNRRHFLRTTGAAAGLVAASAPTAFSPAAGARTRTEVITGSFYQGTAPDWHYVPIDIPSGVRKISVSYTYDKPPPELPGGLSGNVLDIGIFDSSGHQLGNAAGLRGWSGGARPSFQISAGSATPGYLAGPIDRGRWHIQLGPYSVAPTGLHWKLSVTLTFGSRGPTFEPAAAPRSVPGTGRRWYRGDMHTHTIYSDGKRTMRELVTAARDAGLDFIASTEHNNSSAGLEWGRHVPVGFLVIHGEEVTTRGGHWLAVGTPAGTWVDWRYRAQDGQFPRFAGQVHDLGGMVVAAHPFTPFSGTTWTFGYDHVDAVEIWNGPWTLDDQSAVEHWHALLVAGQYRPVVGNSDAHREGQVVGLPQTVVLAESLSTGAIVGAIKKGRAWLAESSAVDLSFRLTSPTSSATCGASVSAAATDMVRVRLDVNGTNGCVASVRGAQGPVAVAPADHDGRISIDEEVPAGLTPFLRVEVRRPEATAPPDPTTGSPGGSMVALTNPIFVNVG